MGELRWSPSCTRTTTSSTWFPSSFSPFPPLLFPTPLSLLSAIPVEATFLHKVKCIWGSKAKEHITKIFPFSTWKTGKGSVSKWIVLEILGIRIWKDWRNKTYSIMFPCFLTHLVGLYQHGINLCWYFQVLTMCSRRYELNTYCVLSNGVDFVYMKNNYRTVSGGAYSLVKETRTAKVNPPVSICYKLW